MDVSLLGRVPLEVWVAGLACLLLAAFVRAVMAGRLVPKSIVDQLIKKSDVDSETIRTLTAQQSAMLEGIREIKDAVTRATSGRGAA